MRGFIRVMCGRSGGSYPPLGAVPACRSCLHATVDSGTAQVLQHLAFPDPHHPSPPDSEAVLMVLHTRYVFKPP